MNDILHRLLDGQHRNDRVMRSYDEAIMNMVLNGFSLEQVIDMEWNYGDDNMDILEMLYDLNHEINQCADELKVWHSHARMVEEHLGSWNLKYDDFPQVERTGHVVRVGHDVIVFPGEEPAILAEARFHKAMRERSKSYWNVRE